MIRVLLVEDNPGDAVILREALEGEPLEIDHAATCEQARALWDPADYMAAIVDQGLPDCRGEELVEQFMADGVPVFLYTGLDLERAVSVALACGARGLVTKRPDVEHLRDVLMLTLRAAVAGKSHHAVTGLESACRRIETACEGLKAAHDTAVINLRAAREDLQGLIVDGAPPSVA